MSQQQKYRELSPRLNLPIFFQPWWLDMVSATWDAAMVEEHGAVQAIWPYHTDTKLGLTLLRQPLLTPYLGPAFFLPAKEKAFGRWNQEDRLYKQLWAQLPQWDFFEVECLPGYNNFFPFHHAGFAHSQRLTYHIDLSLSEDELMGNMKSSQRSHIRQAGRELQVVKNIPGYGGFYKLYEETFQRKGKRHFVNQGLFNKIISTCIDKDAGILLSAVNAEGAPIAYLFACYDADQMYLLLSSVHGEHMHTGAVSLLIWEAIRHGRSLGLKTFDMEGSMDAGIEGFFRSFGGQRVPYLVCTSYRSSLWKWKRALLG